MGGSVPTGEANKPTGTDQPHAIVRGIETYRMHLDHAVSHNAALGYALAASYYLGQIEQPHAIITVDDGDYRVWTALIGPDDADGNPTRHEAYGYPRATFGSYTDAIDYRDMLNQRGAAHE